MLVGHFAVGFAAKRIEPAVSGFGSHVCRSSLVRPYVRQSRTGTIQARNRGGKLFRRRGYCDKSQPVDGHALGGSAGGGLLFKTAKPTRSMGHLRSCSKP